MVEVRNLSLPWIDVLVFMGSPLSYGSRTSATKGGNSVISKGEGHQPIQDPEWLRTPNRAYVNEGYSWLLGNVGNAFLTMCYLKHLKTGY